jgi:opacity protein-like surface antigen
MYYKTTGENKSNGNQYSTSYVSLPLLFKYSIIDRLSVLAGPQFDLLIKSVQNVNGIRKDITHETEERSIYVVGGVEFNFTESLSIDARYLHGFNHIGIRQPLDVTEFKYEGIQLTAAYKF